MKATYGTLTPTLENSVERYGQLTGNNGVHILNEIIRATDTRQATNCRVKFASLY